MVRKRKQPKKCSADMECHAHSIRNLLLARRWDEVSELLETHGEAIVEYMQEEDHEELSPSNSTYPQYHGQCLTEREKSIVKTIVSLMTFNKTPPTDFFRLLFDLNPNFITKYIPSERYCVGYSAAQNIMMYHQFNGPMQILLQNLNYLSSAPQEVSQQYL